MANGPSNRERTMPETIAEPAVMTAEEFSGWANRPERGNTLFELDQGRAIAMPSPASMQGMIICHLTRILSDYLGNRSESGFLVTNKSGMNRLCMPELADRLNLMLFLESVNVVDISTESVESVPTLVVEIRSPSDRDSRMLKRVGQYLMRGVPMVWVIDPEDHVVTSYRDHEFPKAHDEDDALDGNGVLPEFHCPVRDLFRLPGTTHEVQL
jgi:Uma2 family endonuclease